MSITITINAENATAARTQMAELIGARVVQPVGTTAGPAPQDSKVSNAIMNAGQDQPKTELLNGDEDVKTTETAKRPSGRTRDKAAKAAEDAAAAAAQAANREISKGGERTDPETDKQDAADETAETEAAKGKTLTHDDVRAELGAYVKKFGMPATLEDGPKVLALVFPDGKVTKASEIPNTQEALASAVKGIQEMIAKNPFNREAVKAAA